MVVHVRYNFRIRLPSTRIGRIRIFLISLSMNTLRVDGEIFKSGKKKVADSDIAEYVWTALRNANEDG